PQSLARGARRGARGGRGGRARGRPPTPRCFRGDAASSAPPEARDSAGLAHLVRGDLPLPAGSQVYALHPGALEADKVRLLTAADVVAAPAPR
ncbi:hypothetical protein ACWGJT_35935, partial [Streptomyces xantholiticus]